MAELENNTNNGSTNMNQFSQNGSQTVPNSVGVLVLGILSIVFCWCYGIVSIILGIIAIVLANQGEKIYQQNPSAYAMASYKNMKAGKICAIIGMSLSGLYILFLVVYFFIVGTLAFGALNAF
ncbi:MAG TPA: CCC motif membrane protein [Bacteroidia bacterium]|nr:CCC motif membrane protein [Bacteroidia bacterium]